MKLVILLIVLYERLMSLFVGMLSSCDDARDRRHRQRIRSHQISTSTSFQGASWPCARAVRRVLATSGGVAAGGAAGWRSAREHWRRRRLMKASAWRAEGRLPALAALGVASTASDV